MAQAIEQTQEFVKALNEKFGTTTDYTFDVQAGQVYDKITQTYKGHGLSVHAFVQRSTGDLIKAAGWKAPQKNSDGTLAVRYHLDDPEGFAIAVEAADTTGGYLYAK